MSLPRKNGPAHLVDPDGGLYGVLFVLCAAATVWPLWAGILLPFQDLSGNMTYAVVLAEARAPGSLFARTFETGSFLLPNSLAFMAWSYLGPLLESGSGPGLGSGWGFVTAGKVILTVYAVALPLAVDRLLLAAGRERRFALLAFPFVFNWNLMMGFIGFATSLPLLLYALARAYRFRAAPSLARGAAVAALAMLTFLAHAQGYMVLGIAACVFVLATARSPRELLMLAAPFAASLVLFVPWLWVQFVAPPDAMALGGQPLDPVYFSPERHLRRLGRYTIAAWGGDFDDWALIGVAALFITGTLLRHPDPRLDQSGDRRSLELAAVAVLVAYLTFVPEGAGVQSYIGSRLVAVAALLALGWLAMPRRRWARGSMLAAMAALSITFGLGAARAVVRYNQEETGEELLRLVERMPEGSRLATILVDVTSDAVDVQPHEHTYGFHFALNRGLSYTHFHSYYGRHTRWRAGQEVPDPGFAPTAFLRTAAACWYDFELLRSYEPPRWGAFAAEVTYVGEAHRYTLWKLEHDRMPQCRRKPPPPPGPDMSEAAPSATPADGASGDPSR